MTGPWFKRRRHRSRGFSLIEALVALSIAAVTMSGFYAATATGLTLRDKAGAQADAVLLAATIMDRVGVDIPLRVGVQMEGRASAGQWRVVISDTAPPDMGGVANVEGQALAFVSVSVDGRQPVVLRGIRYLQSPL